MSHSRHTPAAPLVTTEDGIRTLSFRPGDIQSAMRVDRPDALVLAYVRAMMCFVLFVPRPRHILMVGLGGGSLAKYCYRHFPDCRITVVELRADIIALREQFCLPPDDGRLRVVHADAAEYVTTVRDEFDVVIVDGFDEKGLPSALGSAKFYAHCRRALTRHGVLAANIFSYDTRFPAMLHRLDLIFNQKVCWLDRSAGNNRIVFAVKAPFRDEAGPLAWPLRVQRWMVKRHGLGTPMLNRWLVHAVLAWCSRPSWPWSGAPYRPATRGPCP